MDIGPQPRPLAMVGKRCEARRGRPLPNSSKSSPPTYIIQTDCCQLQGHYGPGWVRAVIFAGKSMVWAGPGPDPEGNMYFEDVLGPDGCSQTLARGDLRI